MLVRKNVLSEREERKRLRAKQKYEKQFQSLIGVTICLPEAFHDKVCLISLITFIHTLMKFCFSLRRKLDAHVTSQPHQNFSNGFRKRLNLAELNRINLKRFICLPLGFYSSLNLFHRNSHKCQEILYRFSLLGFRHSFSSRFHQKFCLIYYNCRDGAITSVTMSSHMLSSLRYLAHREQVVIAGEEQKLNSINASKVALKKQLDAHMTKLKLVGPACCLYFTL